MPGQNAFSFTVVSVLALLSLTSCGSEKKDPRTQNQLVRVVSVQPAIQSERGFTGVIAARVQSNLGFRVGGKVVERLVDVGQQVKAGQVLMRIDRTDYDHAITAQSGNVAAAKARFIQAKADADRYEGLVSSGAVSKSAYDQAKAAADSARALLNAAEAQFKIARDDAAYSNLVADSDGVVVETLAEPGQVVATGQVVVRLAHAGAREASVNLPETIRPAIGSAAQGNLYGSLTRFPAHLRVLSDAADPLTRTYEARYVLSGAGERSPLGATVTVYLKTASVSRATAVPVSALNDEGHGTGVWIYDTKSSRVSFRPVRVTKVGEEIATISDGLRVGEMIIAMGGHELHQGEVVRVAQTVVVKQ